MRIVHIVCSDRFAGVERYLTYVAPVLAEQGHEVTVVGGEPRRMTHELAASGVRFLPAADPARALRALVGLRGQTDLVHVHMTDAELVGVVTRPVVRAPVVATLHFAQRRGSSRVRRVIADTVARGLTAQVAISEFVAQTAGVPDAVVVPNGVPWNGAEAERERVVLVAQRLEAEKDGATAVRAWAAAGLADQGWRMDVAGGGSERPTLERLARDLGVADSVAFLGIVADLSSRMASASVFLATAPAEPFGLSVVEAMAARLPVVAADGGAHRETVGSVHGAVLFRPGDVELAASSLVALAGSNTERAAYGARLHAEYLRRYTVERHVDHLVQVYDRSVRPRRDRSRAVFGGR